MKEKQNKRGQMTLLVVLAVVLVGAVVIFFLLEQKPFGIGAEAFDAEQFIESCVQDSITEAVEIMMPQGGFIEPKNFKVYNNTKIEYLCRSYGFFGPCINQHPMLINEMKEEIISYIAPRIESCFEEMRKEVERRGSSIEIEQESAGVNISLAPGIIVADIERNVEITEKESTKTFDRFDIRVTSPLYNLMSIAMNIANHERKYCYFEYVGYMLTDPSVDIRKFVMSDSTKIYTIEDRESGKRFNIAIRGCALPAGF